LGKIVPKHYYSLTGNRLIVQQIMRTSEDGYLTSKGFFDIICRGFLAFSSADICPSVQVNKAPGLKF